MIEHEVLIPEASMDASPDVADALFTFEPDLKVTAFTGTGITFRCSEELLEKIKANPVINPFTIVSSRS